MNKQTAQLLEQHFDTAFAAPDGIKKLRELILTLAMRGELVAQEPKDPPASELLREIKLTRHVRRSLGGGGRHEDTKGRRKEELPPIKPEEVPYKLPKGWEWVRLGVIAEYNGRKNISENEIGPDTWLLDLEDIEKETSRILYRATFSERQSKSTKSTFQQGDVLYGKLRPYLDKVVVADRDGICTTEIVPIVPLRCVHAEFLRWLLKRPAFLAHVNSLMYGVKMPRLGTDDAVMSIHPLPPLPEQHRIVARIGQLMGRCDALEKLRKEREEKRLAVHAAAIRQLLTPSPPLRGFVPSCEANSLPPFAFLAEHFGELYTVKENVAELRKAILQLAVMGRLVEQDPSDPPASELLKEIEREKASHEDAKTRRVHAHQTIRLKDIASKIGSGATPSGGKNAYKDSGTPLIRSMNVHFEGFRKEGLAFIDETQAEKLKNVIVKESDVLLNITGASIGRVTIAPKEMELARVNQHVCIIRVTEKILPKYLEIYLASPVFQEFVRSNQVGATREALTKSMIEEYAIPLPPLPEQHRIVARIDQLMGLCDRLDQQIAAATGKQTELLNAVMAQSDDRDRPTK